MIGAVDLDAFNISTKDIKTSILMMAIVPLKISRIFVFKVDVIIVSNSNASCPLEV